MYLLKFPEDSVMVLVVESQPAKLWEGLCDDFFYFQKIIICKYKVHLQRYFYAIYWYFLEISQIE